MTDKELMQQALEALEIVTRHFTRRPSTLKDSEARGEAHKAITALRERLAQPMYMDLQHATEWASSPAGQIVLDELEKRFAPFVAAPQRREWVGLTEEEIAVICGECAASAHRADDISYARAIEAKLRGKNT